MTVKQSFIKYLPFLAALDRTGKISSPIVEPTLINSSMGWTGFTGNNKDKKKHFNKKRHGRMLRKKHKKS